MREDLAQLNMPYSWHKVAQKREVLRSRIHRLLLHTQHQGRNVYNNDNKHDDMEDHLHCRHAEDNTFRPSENHANGLSRFELRNLEVHPPLFHGSP